MSNGKGEKKEYVVKRKQKRKKEHWEAALQKKSEGSFS